MAVSQEIVFVSRGSCDPEIGLHVGLHISAGFSRPSIWVPSHLHATFVHGLPVEFVFRRDGVTKQFEIVTCGKWTFITSPHLPCRIAIVASSWHEWYSWDQLPSFPTPTIYTALVGECRGIWFDGPIAFALGENAFRDAIVSGGRGQLELNFSCPRAEKLYSAEELNRVLPLSKTSRTCLAWWFAASMPRENLTVTLDDLRPIDAASLVILRQVRTNFELRSAHSSLPAPWRRLLQHLGLRVTQGPSIGINLSKLSERIPTDLVGLLIKQINEMSAIIPPSLFRATRANSPKPQTLKRNSITSPSATT